MKNLEHPHELLEQLKDILVLLEGAGKLAGETWGNRTDLIGAARTILGGISDTVWGLQIMLEEELENPPI